MEDFYKGYVRTKNKKCVEKFKDRTDLSNLKEISQYDEYAGILAEDAILIDIDDPVQSEKMLDIVDSLQLNCRVIKTTRGKHFLFKNSSYKVCKTGVNLAIGLRADIKVGVKASYEVLKYAGKVREIEYDIDPEAGEKYQEVPRMFLPVPSKLDFAHMEAGDGRNDALFGYILSLQGNAYTKDEIKEILTILNKFVLKDPMSAAELEVIMRDEAFQKPIFYQDKKFLHDAFGDYLIRTRHICNINGALHIYEDGEYKPGYKAVQKAMLEEIKDLNKTKRQEVLSYLEIQAEKKEISTPNYILFANGVLDLAKNTMLPPSPEYIITNKIPWSYVTDAYCELTDKTLNKLACNDPQIRDLLEECIGYCFFRANQIAGGKAFVLTGGKSNGKSTFLDMIKCVLGDENISALDIAEMSDRFNTVTMFGKLANIGDDIGDEFLMGAQIALFKKIVTGNRIKAEHKGQDVFEFNPYVKLLFSANDIPRMRDGSGAVLRRLEIVPFNATFSANDPDYDPFIINKLTAQDSAEYLVRIGVEGLKRALANNQFTKSDLVEAALDSYEEMNNPITMFVRDYGVENIYQHQTCEVKTAYDIFCRANGLSENMSIQKFTMRLKQFAGIDTKSVRIPGKNTVVRVYVRKE